MKSLFADQFCRSRKTHPGPVVHVWSVAGIEVYFPTLLVLLMKSWFADQFCRSHKTHPGPVVHVWSVSGVEVYIPTLLVLLMKSWFADQFCRSRKTHPGPVVHLSDNPVDTNKVGRQQAPAWACLLSERVHDFKPGSLSAAAWMAGDSIFVIMCLEENRCTLKISSSSWWTGSVLWN